MSTSPQPVAGTFQPLNAGGASAPQPLGGTFQPLNAGGASAPQSLGGTFQPLNAPASAQPPAEETFGMVPQARMHWSGAQGSINQIPYSKVHQALDQGLLFADKPTLQRYAQVHAADPLDESRVDQWIDKHPILSTPLQGIIGAGRGLLKTATGRDFPATSRLETELQLAAATPTRTPQEAGAEAFENIGEFFSGEELLGMLGRSGQMMNLAEKLRTTTGLAKLINEVPMIGKLLKIGASAAKQGTVAGAQTLAKGGTPGTAGVTALGTAALGGMAASAADLGAARLAARLPGTDIVGGEEFETPAARDIPKPTKNQAAGQVVLKKAAQSAAAAHIEELNEARREPPPAGPQLPARTGEFQFQLKGIKPVEGITGGIAQPAAKFEPSASRVPEGAEPGLQNKAQMGSLAATVPNRMLQRTQAYTSAPTAEATAADRLSEAGGGDMTTKDPNVARGHLNNLDQIIRSAGFKDLPPEQQNQILEAREDTARQLGAYHEQVRMQLPGYGRPQMPEIDPAAAVAKIGNHTDTANLILKQAQDGYNHVTDSLGLAGESPQRLNQVRLAYQAAENDYMSATTEEGLRAAETKIDATHDQLRDMVQNRIPNAITLKEFSALNDAYKNGLGLKKVANAIDSSRIGFAESTARRGYEYSGFDGRKLQRNMDRLIRQMGRAKVERLMGRENLDNVLRVAQLNTTNAGRAAFGVALRAVQKSMVHLHVGPISAGGYLAHLTGMPWELGAGLGWTGAEGLQRLGNVILTNPKIGKNLVYALEYGAKSENYAPFIAQMVRQFVQSQQEE